MIHFHHIVPLHAGGTDEPSNLKPMTISEHAEAHRLLWEQYGRKGDRLAWRALSGQIGKEEIQKERTAFIRGSGDNSKTDRKKAISRNHREES